MIKIPEDVNLENYTLILPSVAVGNVGQLCADLLISNLNLRKIGSLWNPMFLPICGLDPYSNDSNSVCTASEFYQATLSKVLLLQLRSPYVGNSNNFFEELAEFVGRKKIGKVVILTSSYAYERADSSQSELRYLTSDARLSSDEKLLESLGWRRHAKVAPEDQKDSTERCYVSGGGFANGLYEYFKSTKIPCTVLFCYCSEGDNVSDALKLFDGLNCWLNLTKATPANGIQYPPSWQYFFGNPPSSDIY